MIAVQCLIAMARSSGDSRLDRIGSDSTCRARISRALSSSNGATSRMPILCATGRRSLMNHPSSSANALLRFATALADQLAVGGRVLDERHNNRRLELVHETRQVRRKGTTYRRAFSKPPRILVRIRHSKSASSCTGASSGLGSRQPATQKNRYQAQSRAMSTDCSRAPTRPLKGLRLHHNFSSSTS